MMPLWRRSFSANKPRRDVTDFASPQERYWKGLEGPTCGLLAYRTIIVQSLSVYNVSSGLLHQQDKCDWEEVLGLAVSIMIRIDEWLMITRIVRLQMPGQETYRRLTKS